MSRKKFQIGNLLADGLKETISVGNTYQGMLNIEVIPITKIELDTENPRDLALQINDLLHGLKKDDPLLSRKTAEKENLLSISESIKREGLLNPIIVYKSDSVYKLVAGERRTLASILAGKTNIQAKILDGKPSELRLSMLQWFENIEREDLSLCERINNLKKISQSFTAGSSKKMSAKDLSELIGCSFFQASNYIVVLESDDEIIEALENNRLKNLEKAAFLSRIEDKQVRDKALNLCISGSSLANLKRFVELEKISTKAKPEKTKRPGRQAAKINLGSTTNISLVKWILSLMVKAKTNDNVKKLLETIDWEDYSSVTDGFKSMITLVEKELDIEKGVVNEG